MQKICPLGSSKTHRKTSKNHTRVALNFLNQYEEYGNDLLKQIITIDKSWIQAWFGKKNGISTEKIQE